MPRQAEQGTKALRGGDGRARPTVPPDLSPVGMLHTHFEKALESPCPFHEGQAKHLLKDYATMKGYIYSTLGQ
jgi:hypothetical protein